MSESDVLRPGVGTSADVTLVSRGITVTATVEASDASGLAVRPEGQGGAWLPVEPGDLVELYWTAGDAERTLPARITDVDETAEDVVWRLSATGPAERSQRRRTVRARLEVSVSMPWSDGLLAGHTVDLSEAGMRALVDGWALPPDDGARTEITIDLDDRILHLTGEIVRQAVQGPRWLLSLRFLDVSEQDGDALRRRVFKALRDERATSA